MTRYGFTMELKNESVILQYEQLHREIGADVIAAHSRSGIRNYSIYRLDLQLFAYFESDDPQASIDRLSQEPIMEQWWNKTNPLMRVVDKGTPWISELPMVFHMD